MATLFCQWPTAQRAAAETYLVACGHRYGALTGEANAVWGRARQDADGRWIAPMLAPPWFFAEPGDFAEPPSCLALRDGAAVIQTPDWPAETD